MPQQQQKNDDRNGYAQQPHQDCTHGCVLPNQIAVKTFFGQTTFRPDWLMSGTGSRWLAWDVPAYREGVEQRPFAGGVSRSKAAMGLIRAWPGSLIATHAGLMLIAR